jgi:hypothetical protein
MPESFRCDQCGKSFPTEGDVRQHVDMLHGSAGAGSYEQREDRAKEGGKPIPMPPGQTPQR